MDSPVSLPPEIEVRFSGGQLVAAIAQDFATKEILMLAWMNKDALLQTLVSGEVTYWSRSRNEIWRKGATSGNTQKLISLTYDCDGDAILLQVEQIGSACHTGSRSCFSREIAMGAR